MKERKKQAEEPQQEVTDPPQAARVGKTSDDHND